MILAAQRKLDDIKAQKWRFGWRVGFSGGVWSDMERCGPIWTKYGPIWIKYGQNMD
jgi:hypothetical protein